MGAGPHSTADWEHASFDSWQEFFDQTRGSLFESPRHLEELPLPEETKRFVRVLKSPHKGSLVYLIGTAHVSKASMEDVRLLIEAVKPDVVAVELDPEGLKLMECDLMAAAGEVSLHTTWEALSVVQRSYAGHFEKLWSAYQPHIESQALGIPYGCDARSAIEAARQIGARIEPIDQSIATITSLLEELDHARIHERAKTTLSGIVRIPQSTALMLQLLIKNPFEKSDGDAQREAAAFGRIVAAFLSGKPAPLDDVAVFQSLKNKALEATRLECVKGELCPAFDETEGPNVYSALLHERDRLMGLKLAALAKRRRKKVVAVVGAAHVPGITTRFVQYTAGHCNPFDGVWENLDIENETRLDKERKERELIVHEVDRQIAWEDSEVPGLFDPDMLRGFLFAAAAGAGAFAWFNWPVTTAELITGGFTAHGLLTLGLAAFTAKWAQFGEYLEAASMELRRKPSLDYL
ncbi:hypothetical protein KFL_000110140 [Klebsormidium nitens]|uniref:TraB family protein n=1 Tax=Klebsormidium nitens TaxID=105231 RepID=A0A1Y1HP11_KLENI|nr:hypothetical protein KFL_000110140 [Klebsormidium nitens]|eukprot:GAQ78317.1 hypothetical protein KFL_000110140 [Klebsormidium nitens]